MSHGVRETSHVYFLRNEDGELIYIGRSHDLKARFSAHSAQTPWWEEVASTEIVMSGSYFDVFDEELRLIGEHTPKYNLYGATKNYRAYFSHEDYEAVAKKAASVGLKPHRLISQIVMDHLIENEAA